MNVQESMMILNARTKKSGNLSNTPHLTPSHECPVYDTKLSDGEVPVMLKLLGMLSTPSLLSLPGSLWPGVVVPDKFLPMGQVEIKYVLNRNWIEWNRIVLTVKLCTYAKVNCLK